MQTQSLSCKSPALAYALFFLVGGSFAHDLGARENRHDVVAKALAPFINILAKETDNPNRALSAELVLEKMTGLLPGMVGARAAIAWQSPDKLLLRGPVLDQQVTICRNAQEIWVYPGGQIDALMKSMKNVPPADPTFKLGRFQLPFSEKQLVLLPALLQITDAGDQEAGGEICRVLDVALLPELARSLKISQWVMRLWLRSDYSPARIDFRKPNWQARVAVEKWRYAPSLAAETWQPTVEQAGDILQLSPPRYKQLLDAVTGQ